jgi:hypothetical protein
MSRPLACCGGATDGMTTEHEPNCPNIVRAGLSWIEDTRHGDKIRTRALAAFEAIVAERDELRASRGQSQGDS